MFEGIITALITPFDNNKIDFKTLEHLVQRQIDAGIKSIVMAGSTGEGTSLSDIEYYHLIERANLIAAGRINIIANVGAASTEDLCNKINKLNQLDINGIMCTLPYYVRPEQAGLIQHLKKASSATPLPIMLYLNLGRTGCNISDESLIEISKLPNIMAIKDASNDMQRPLRLSNLIKDNFNFMIGDDNAILAYSACGGKGCVSAIANILPKTMNKIYNFCAISDFDNARKLLQQILPIINATSIESNPIGIKHLLYLLNFITNEIRLPLTDASTNAQQSIQNIVNIVKQIEEI
ncbi:MAG: 4-hydroxy-tetrahydrodipicolinate synthase [Rickettsiaceae bacterium]|nr:4-hydroxy-tetrahydrodipicolinate synthase [Rickettsiaceae bacterium]